jgi:hypothetical protein
VGAHQKTGRPTKTATLDHTNHLGIFHPPDLGKLYPAFTGERAAAIYTIVETAKLNGLDPQAYLRHVLDRIADHPINRIADLLPWNITIPDQG